MLKRLTILAVSLLAAGNAAAIRPLETEIRLQRARELFELGRWSDARHEFLVLKSGLTPADPALSETADFYLALCAVELEHAEVEQRLQKFLREHAVSVFTNDAMYALATYYCTREEYAKAREAFVSTDYARLGKEQRAGYDVRMGYIEFLNGDNDAAYVYFDRIDRTSAYYDHAVYYKAYIEYERENYTNAKWLFSTLLDSDAYSKLSPYYLLQIEYREGNYPYVVQKGEELLKVSSENQRMNLQRLMAESWFRMNNYRKSLDYIRAYAQSGGTMGREENYIWGYSLYRTANYREACEPLRKVCGADDALTQNASYHLGDCYLRIGQKEKAAESFAMASNENFDAAIAEESLFNYGKLRYELGGGTFNEAINILTRYVDTYPYTERTVEAKELLVAAYLNSNNYDSAYAAIKSIPDPDSNIRAALQKITYYRALEAYTQGDIDRAEQMLQESTAIGISPKYGALGTFWLGEIAYGRGDYRKAAERYSDYLARAPKSEREYKMALYNLGYARMALGEIEAAGGSFSSFLSAYRERDSYRADALNRLGDTEYKMRNYSTAAKTYGDAAAVGTIERYYAEYQQALALGMSGRTDRKIAILKSIVDADSGDYADEAAYELGRTYISREEYSHGAAVLEPFVERYPNSPNYTAALLDLGLAYFNIGDTERSLKFYDMAVRKDPNSSEAKDALLGMREIYVNTGDVNAYFDYAETAGVECDLSNITRDSLTFESAQKIYIAGRTAEAVKPLENYIAEFPKGYYRNDAYFCLSDCYLRNGDTDKAVESLYVLSKQPANQYTMRVLGELSRQAWNTKRYDIAAESYRKLYDAESSSQARADAALGYERSVRAAGDDDAIVAMADDVAAMYDAGETARREAKYAKAKILQKRGDNDGALALFRELSGDVRYVEGAEAAYAVIESEYEAGRSDEAEQLIFAFSEKNTPHAYWLGRAFLLLGDIYRARGDMFQARATYQSIVDGYMIANDGVLDDAKERIRNLN